MSRQPIDLSTGLPQLPPDRFFRVTKNSAGPLVQLRQRVKWWKFEYSYVVTYHYVVGWGQTRDLIISAARGCLDKEEALLEKKKRLGAEDFYGDYPPRSLNADPTHDSR